LRLEYDGVQDGTAASFSPLYTLSSSLLAAALSPVCTDMYSCSTFVGTEAVAVVSDGTSPARLKFVLFFLRVLIAALVLNIVYVH
jgi:hypothetical protein